MPVVPASVFAGPRDVTSQYHGMPYIGMYSDMIFTVTLCLSYWPECADVGFSCLGGITSTFPEAPFSRRHVVLYNGSGSAMIFTVMLCLSCWPL